jgi:hypothetical protein
MPNFRALIKVIALSALFLIGFSEIIVQNQHFDTTIDFFDLIQSIQFNLISAIFV